MHCSDEARIFQNQCRSYYRPRVLSAKRTAVIKPLELRNFFRLQSSKEQPFLFSLQTGLELETNYFFSLFSLPFKGLSYKISGCLRRPPRLTWTAKGNTQS
jgi:hypothetical protein